MIPSLITTKVQSYHPVGEVLDSNPVPTKQVLSFPFSIDKAWISQKIQVAISVIVETSQVVIVIIKDFEVILKN